MHRWFETCKPYAETLVSNAGYLVQHLNAVGLHRAYCFSFGDIDSMTSALDAVYGPGMNSSEEVKGTFHPGSTGGPIAAGEAWWTQWRLGDEAIQQLNAADESLNQ